MVNSLTFEQIIVSIISAILISAITSWITVRLALRRFYTEHWWVRKDEAYTSIIDALSDLVISFDAFYNESLGITKISDERRKEINELSKKGHATLKRATNIGSFVISKEAEQALKRYWEDSEEKHDPDDWLWVIEHDYAKAITALEELKKCAKRDLRVHRLP